MEIFVSCRPKQGQAGITPGRGKCCFCCQLGCSKWCGQGLSTSGGEKPWTVSWCRHTHGQRSLEGIRNKEKLSPAGTGTQKPHLCLHNPLPARPPKAVNHGKVMKVNGEDLLRWLHMFFCILAQEGRRRDGWAFCKATHLSFHLLPKSWSAGIISQYQTSIETHLSEQFESAPIEAKPFRNPSRKHSLSGQGVRQNIITDFLFSL